MDLLNSPMLAALRLRIDNLSARTSVIAENLANADTPGFIARDVAPPRAPSGAIRLAVSDPRHVGAPHAASQGARIVAAPDGEASLTGNAVSLETQMVKLSETRMDYQLATSLYRKGLDMMRLAVRGGR